MMIVVVIMIMVVVLVKCLLIPYTLNIVLSIFTDFNANAKKKTLYANIKYECKFDAKFIYMQM